MNKKRIIKDYDQMPQEILMQLKARFPHGYQEHLLRFNNANGELISALPFETEEAFYLVRMNVSGGYHIVDEDVDDEYEAIVETEGLDLNESEG